MDIQSGFFYIFSIILLWAAWRVVDSRQVVHSALYLVLAFTQAAALWLMLDAEFLAMTLILVYVGAVMVLFLFVLMMFEKPVTSRLPSEKKHAYRFLAIGLALVLALELSAVWLVGFSNSIDITSHGHAIERIGGGDNTYQLGLVLYDKYVYPVQIAAVLLLVAIVSAIALTWRPRRHNKSVDPSLQVQVRPQDRVRLVSVPVVPEKDQAQQIEVSSSSGLSF
jgi:NADH-quinone oxidoreductase subunit J